jgi:putative transposase
MRIPVRTAIKTSVRSGSSKTLNRRDTSSLAKNRGWPRSGFGGSLTPAAGFACRYSLSTAVLNTLLSRLHPHVHCVIPAGGLSLDHTHWIKSRSRFFLSIKVLRRVFRGKFVAGLKQAFQSGRLSFRGSLATLAQPKTFAAWLRSLFRKDWVVYAKPPFGGPEYVLQYLRPLHPSRGHLQPSSGLVYGEEGHLPLAGLRS